MPPSAALVQESIRWSSVPYKKDRIVSYPGSPELRLSEILQFIYHDRMTPFARKGKRKGFLQSALRPGWVHMGRDKQDLEQQKTTKFVRTYQTMLQLVDKGYQYLTFGTFRVRRRHGHERNRRNLNSCHAFVIDIDNKTRTPDDILRFCSESGLMPPSLINETDRGYHVWFVLSQDIVGPHEYKKDEKRSLTKAGAFYLDVNRYLISLFEKGFPSDDSGKGADNTVGGERYIRVPTRVRYFSGNKYSILDFAHLKKELNLAAAGQQLKTRPRPKGNPRTRLYIPHAALKKDPAYEKLLTMQPAVGDRRYTAFTIALLFYACNLKKEQTTAFLEDWFKDQKFGEDFQWKEVHNAIESAYSGEYRGAHSSWIFRLTGLKPKLFFTRRVAEEDRKYKTSEQWETRFLKLLNDHGGQWSGSSRELSELLGMNSKSMLARMIEKLEDSGIIRKQVLGRGRAATTAYSVVPQDPPEKPQDKVVSLTAYRMEKNTIFADAHNAPNSYRNLLKSSREGGREGFYSPDDPPGG